MPTCRRVDVSVVLCVITLVLLCCSTGVLGVDQAAGAAAAASSAVGHGSFYRQHARKADFDVYMKQFGKQYAVDAIDQRLNAWLANDAKIRAHNAQQQVHGYTLGHNSLSDLTFEEFRARYLMKSVPQASAAAAAAASKTPRVKLQDTSDIPASVDWRDQNVVTGVKNQGGSGTCWAFAAVAAMETAWALTGRDLVSFSEQQIVDCNNGVAGTTSGGSPWGVYDWTVNYNSGYVTGDHYYPYTGGTGTCSRSQPAVARFAGFEGNSGGNEVDLQRIIARQPASVCMNVQNSFHLYNSGVYDESNCAENASKDNGHCFAIMGYGVENNVAYWVIKNSWGSGWGQSGYMKFIRGVNRCGIGSGAQWPLPSKDGSKLQLGATGESCTQTCSRLGAHCSPFVSLRQSTLPFKMFSINCVKDLRAAWAADQPAYVSVKTDGNYGRCLGTSDMYNPWISCDGSYPTVQRMCQCEWNVARDYLLGQKGAPCTQVCQAGATTPCDPVQFSNDVYAAANLLKPNAIFDGRDWWAADQPAYVIDPHDGNFNRTLGLNYAPYFSQCGGSYGTVQRFCHCKPQYYIGKLGADCTTTCRDVGLRCDPAINTGNSKDRFTELGINCDSTASNWDYWNAQDQPCWVSATNDPNGNYGKCLGFKNVPASVPCSAKFWSVQRLCHCVGA